MSTMATYPNASLVQRYSRQMLVPQMDGMTGQLALQNSKVLIVGAGGIGSSAILYLAGAGVGSLTLVDFDVVEESNLHRQVIHDTAAATSGALKAESAAARVAALNPHISCEVVLQKLTRGNAMAVLTQKRFDLVVDATDNFDARYLINDACNLVGLPLVSGSAVGMEGQLTVFQPHSGFACYRCMHPNPSPAEACRSCDNAGVVGPVPGVIGTLQAVEAIKLLIRSNTPADADAAHSHQLKSLVGRQLYYDAIASEFHEFALPKRSAECASCRHMYSGSLADRQASAGVLFPEEGTEAGGGSCKPTPSPASLLSAEHRISARDYDSSVLRAQVPHVLLDVRSRLQFGIVSLSHLFSSPATATATATATDLAPSPARATLLNIPFIELQAGAAARAEGPAACAGGALQTLLDALQPSASASAPDECGISTVAARLLPVYVLCRRGVDSVRASQLLLQLREAGVEGVRGMSVVNVDGGLTAWHAQVDSSFPKY